MNPPKRLEKNKRLYGKPICNICNSSKYEMWTSGRIIGHEYSICVVCKFMLLNELEVEGYKIKYPKIYDSFSEIISPKKEKKGCTICGKFEGGSYCMEKGKIYCSGCHVKMLSNKIDNCKVTVMKEPIELTDIAEKTTLLCIVTKNPSGITSS